MVAATRLLAYNSAAHQLPAPVCTLLYILAIVATIVAFVGLLMSLIGGVGNARGRWGAMPLFTNWMYAAAVALIAWLLLAFLC